MNQETQKSVVTYLEKSYSIIQRLTETNRILNSKNKELLAKNIFYQSKIKLLQQQNKEMKKQLNLFCKKKENNNELKDTENEFEIL